MTESNPCADVSMPILGPGRGRPYGCCSACGTPRALVSETRTETAIYRRLSCPACGLEVRIDPP